MSTTDATTSETDESRPESCLCFEGSELECWPCRNAGFETVNPDAEPVDTPDIPSEKDLLTQADGIGPTKADALLSHFGTGSKVAKAASSGWGAITDVNGFSQESAKSLFHKLNDADVYHTLKNQRYAGARR